MTKLLDTYYRLPFLVDLILISIIWFFNYYFDFWEVNISLDRLNAISSSLIDTSVSLAGFILAALTIIVTFKSNIKAKGLEDSENALEMILASENYKSIVRTFKSSIIELCLIFVALYLFQTIEGNLSLNIYFRIVVSAIVLLFLGITRSLYLLFKILSIDSK